MPSIDDHQEEESSSTGGAAAVRRQALSVGIATGAYGVSFGALSVAAGFSIWATMASSLLVFTGGSQFAIVGIVGSGGSAAAAVATSSMLGVRNGLYGLQVAPTLGAHGWRRLVAAHWTIDESTAVSQAQRDPQLARLGFWSTGAAVFVFWNAMTLLGAIVGNALGDPRRYGLDAAASAAFLALLWPRLRHRDARGAAVAALAIALFLAPHVPAGIPVLAAALVAVIVGVRTRVW